MIPDSQTLRLAHRGQDPKTLNPWIASDATSSELAALMFEGLIYLDPDTDEPKPNLAKEFKVSKDSKTIRITMRDDIKWNDGEPITVEDVEYTWNTLIRDQVAISSLRDVLLVNGKFPELKIINNKTIELKTEEVFAPFLRTLNVEIAPKHDIEKFFKKHKAETLEQKQIAFNNYLSTETQSEAIVCSGAFKLKKIISGQRIEFIKNKNYFKKDLKGNQLPYLDRIIFTYAVDDAAAVFKFLAKEIHVLNVSPQNAAFIKSLEGKYGFKLYDLGPSTGTNFIWFNLSKNIPEPKYSWFNDRNFREAISYAIDRDSLVNNVYQGLAMPLFTAESLQSKYLNTNITGFKKDISKSKQLLESSGFYFKNNKSGIKLFDKNGNRVEFNLFTNAGNTERELMATIISSNLKALGVKVNFKALEFNNFVSRVMQGKDYDAGILGLTGSNEPNNGSNVWRSNGRLHLFDIKEFQNQSTIRNWELEIDELLSQGTQTIDTNKRKEIYNKMQNLIFKENPLIYLVSAKNLIAINKQVGGLHQTKYHGIMPFMEQIYIKTKN